MKIAVTSQNRKTITGHAGSCRIFWIFTIEDNKITSKELLELPKEQAFRASPPDQPHLLDGIDQRAVISGEESHLSASGPTSTPSVVQYK